MAASSLYDPAFDPPAEVEKKGGIRLGEGPDRGRLSFWIALLSACLFLGAGLHVHADRTHRRPIVTWEPAGVILAILAAAVCIAAMILALRTIGRFATDADGRRILGQTLSGLTFGAWCRSVWRSRWAVAAFFCAGEVTFMLLVFLAALYED
jgi:hypothetical protein